MAGMLAQGWNRMRHSAVFFGALGTLVRIGANLLLLPLLLEKLTTAELALWWVFVALGALANLADFGFGQAVSRVYSYLWAGADDFETEGLPPLTTADPNFERIHQFTESVRQLYSGLGLIALLLLASIGTFLVAPSAEQGGDNLVFCTVWAAYIGALAFNLSSSYWGQV